MYHTLITYIVSNYLRIHTISYIITGGFQYSNCERPLAHFGWFVHDHLSEPIVFDHDSRFVYIIIDSAVCLHFVDNTFFFTFLQPLHPHMLLCCPWLPLPMPLCLEPLPWLQVCCCLHLSTGGGFLFTFLIICLLFCCSSYDESRTWNELSNCPYHPACNQYLCSSPFWLGFIPWMGNSSITRKCDLHLKIFY